MKSMTVVYKRDETGWWVAEVREMPGCHTQGKSLRQARRRIREALELFVDEPEEIELRDEIHLPEPLRQALEKEKQVKEVASAQVSKAQALTRQTATMLINEADLSMRDAAELLGLSHQRVQQLLQN